MFNGDGGVIFNFVKADKTADFEMVMGKLKEALAKSDKPERKAQAAGWKYFKAAEPGPGGAVIYVFIMDPVAEGRGVFRRQHPRRGVRLRRGTGALQDLLGRVRQPCHRRACSISRKSLSSESDAPGLAGRGSRHRDGFGGRPAPAPPPAPAGASHVRSGDARLRIHTGLVLNFIKPDKTADFEAVDRRS